MNFDTNNHSVFSLNYHLVMVVKYRRKVINDKISNTEQVIIFAFVVINKAFKTARLVLIPVKFPGPVIEVKISISLYSKLFS